MAYVVLFFCSSCKEFCWLTQVRAVLLPPFGTVLIFVNPFKWWKQPFSSHGRFFCRSNVSARPVYLIIILNHEWVPKKKGPYIAIFFFLSITSEVKMWDEIQICLFLSYILAVLWQVKFCRSGGDTLWGIWWPWEPVEICRKKDILAIKSESCHESLPAACVFYEEVQRLQHWNLVVINECIGFRATSHDSWIYLRLLRDKEFIKLLSFKNSELIIISSNSSTVNNFISDMWKKNLSRDSI